ncbi:MAG TPA: hypothetical protein VNO26_08815 [Candidatus Limnocylindria bacterium]|nr:hypothetical protein [Candidatus Limnocylindria bacterium]
MLALLVASGAGAQGAPDFDAAPWTGVGCPADELVRHTTPAGVDLAGDATYPAIYIAHDADYAYFRYRVDGDPSGPGTFAQYSWTALMQVPWGDPFRYQYQLSLNGKDETVEIWENTVASVIDFAPLFQDSSEVLLFSAPSAGLARIAPAGDGSSFGGTPDWFVDFAVPVPALVQAGAIAEAADLDRALYYPATSTNPNNYNKSTLTCSFLPAASLSLEAAVTPALVPAHVTTPLAFTLTVTNTGGRAARGLVVGGTALPAYVSGAVVTVASDDPQVTWTIVNANPLEVRTSLLPAGASLTVTLAAEATPDCNAADFVNHVSAFATNASDVFADAALAIGGAGTETCDGLDNDCDGIVDDGGAAACDDGDACTVDACVAGACTATPVDGCTPCTTGADCEDAEVCTLDVCGPAGVCEHETLAGCPACTTDADCSDGDACTTEQCGATGSCLVTVIPGCTSCAADAECDDGDACTTDACAAGACTHTAAPSCVPAEVCGDCLDNDGDDLVDYEDEDCCAAQAGLDVRRMRLKPTTTTQNVRGNRLRMKVRNVAFEAAALDPTAEDTTLQIADGAGQLFCQTVPAEHWKNRNERVFRFKDKTGAFAGGLAKGTFKVKKNGRIMFAAKGKRVTLVPTSGQAVTVTLRVGGQCAQMQLGMRALRRAERGLVFP